MSKPPVDRLKLHSHQYLAGDILSNLSIFVLGVIWREDFLNHQIRWAVFHGMFAGAIMALQIGAAHKLRLAIVFLYDAIAREIALRTNE